MTEQIHPSDKWWTASAWTISYLNPPLVKGLKETLEMGDLVERSPKQDAKSLHEQFTKAWQNRGNKGLVRLCFGFYGRTHFIGALVFSLEELVKPFQALFLKIILEYLQGDQSFLSAMLSALGFAVGGYISAFVHHKVLLDFVRMGENLRMMTSSVLFKYMTSLTPEALGSLDSGHLNTLLANDSHRFTLGMKFVHAPYMFLLVTPIYMYIFASLIGWSVIFIVIAFSIFIPLIVLFALAVGYYRTKAVRWTDQRTKTINEALLGVELMKIFTWEKPLIERIRKFRLLETKWILNVLYLRSITNGFSWGGMFLVAAPALYHYYWRGYSLNVPEYFLYINLCRSYWWLTIAYSQLCCEVASGVFVSIGRINSFLHLPQREAPEQVDAGQRPGVRIKDGLFEWASEDKVFQLKHVQLQLSDPQLTMIIGPIGSGKSGLLHAILQEMPKLSGEIEVSGQIAYAPQVPWIFNASVQENILFDRPFDEEWYDIVAEACALLADFKQLPNGDKTMIGERGVNLSGGQKARVSLARACYGRPDILIADSPLAAVDSKVANKMFESVFGAHSILSGKIRLLVSHHIHFLPQAGHIIVLDDGKIISQGKYESLSSELDFEKFIPKKDDTKDSKLRVNMDKQKGLSDNETAQSPDIIQKEQNETGSVSWATYKTLFDGSGGLIVWSFLMMLVLLGDGISIFTILFMSDAAQHNRNWGYVVLLAVLTPIFMIFRGALFNNRIMASNVALHEGMVSGVLNASMRFFESQPIGRILNRFTQDQSQVDELLPIFSWDCIVCMTAAMVMAILTIPTVPIVLVLLLPIGYALHYVRNVAIHSSREIKRMEAASRSPMYAHFNNTLAGLTTMRPLGGIPKAIERFYEYQNDNVRASLNFEAACRWLGFRVDFCGATYAGAVAFGIVLCVEYEILDMSVELAGVTLLYALNLCGIVSWGVRMTAETENQMTSVERIIQYSKIPAEPTYGCNPPLLFTGLPKSGALAFKDTSVQYRKELDPVLKGLNLSISSGEKIGICGRTGSGKSTLLRALMRLVHITEGGIHIDGMNTLQLPLFDVRSCFAVIPQAPILFSGSIRHNLDPFHQSTEEEIWEALGIVQMQDKIDDLKMDVAEFGGNFSVGEQQLLCVARALLKKNCNILLVDEATANVDLKTDAVIQEVLREKFPRHTVLVIAHRLQTILGCDRILVLNSGVVAQFGTPEELATREGIFQTLMENANLSIDDICTPLRVDPQSNVAI